MEALPGVYWVPARFRVLAPDTGAVVPDSMMEDFFPDIAWDDAEAKDLLVSSLRHGRFGPCWPRWIPMAWTSRTADAYALLVLVAGQDVEPADRSDSTDGRFARKVAPTG